MSVSAVLPYSPASPTRSPYLSLCLSSLCREGEVLGEIIVVSNGEGADFLEISELDERIRVITAHEALGYGGAINLGARQASSEFLLFCDADTFCPEPGWIERHLRLHSTNPYIGLTSSKLINYRTGRILDCGIGRTRYNNFHPFRDLPANHQETCHSRQTQMACSAVMLISRDLFLQMDGFDRNLRNYYQDIDLCLRLKRENKEVWVVGDAVAFHRGGSTSLARQPFRIDERAYFTLKNGALLDVDFADYLYSNLMAYSDHLAFHSPFGLVNLSTMTDCQEAVEVISRYADLSPLAAHTPPERDLESVVLPDFLSIEILQSSGPLLILVDRHISLRFNALWKACRDTRNDVIVDRHANACLFDQLTIP
jgi:GT2 family glycosyltransferase